MGWRLFFERLAILDDPDAGQIRGHAITALIRAGERAERTVAPALAAASYVTAAELSSPGPADGTEAAASLWERAAQAEITNGSWAKVVASVNRLVPLGRTVTPPTARPAWAGRASTASTLASTDGLRPVPERSWPSGGTEQLAFHLGLAKQNGVTEQELIEAITHLAFCAGWPKAMSAMAVAKKVFRSS